MNRFNEDMKRKKDTFDKSSARTLKRLKFWETGEENPADKIIDDATVTLADRIARAADNTARALKQWKLLLADYGVSPIFFMQPLSYWCDKTMTTEERGVFHAIDSCPNNFYRLFSNVLGNEVHKPFFSAICDRAQGIYPVRDSERFTSGALY